jgi:tetratricopeptide (TPR) repeat protein
MSIPALLGAAAACYGPPEMPPETPLGHPEAAAVLVQAVDAGTGAALSDAEMTVRYLVRSPITLDASSVEQVTSVEPYEIRHVIQEESLVLEMRLEADSYFKLDTVLTVPKGTTAGPLTMRLSRRLDAVARREPEPAPPVTPPPTGSGRGTLPAASSGPDRAALLAGNRAFERGSWLEATEAYARMPLPDDPASQYGQEYQQALLRRGVAHMNRAEYDSALEVLESAVSYGTPGFQTFLRLAAAQCAVGRTEEGRGTLAQLQRGLNRMSPNEQLLVGALIDYERGICSHGEFDRAQTTRERVRTGSAAIQELQAFIDFGERIEPVPPVVQTAVEDARSRIDLIRRRMAGN